jgi:type I restriction enzyme R subunit
MPDIAPNFAFLADKKEFALFAPACVEAERVLASSPAMCAVGCRKALELAVKWAYAADHRFREPYQDNLQALLHEPSFCRAVPSDTWKKLPFIAKLGNLAVHTEKTVPRGDAVQVLAWLFEFVQWLDYRYGERYTARKFSPAAIPAEKVAVDTRRIREQQSLLEQKDAELEALRQQVEAMSARLTEATEKHTETRSFAAEDISEYDTRKRYIDVDLRLLGWEFGVTVREEVEVRDMAGVPGQSGFADYVLYGRDGLPLAVVEAKRSSRDPNAGKQQALLYADALEKMSGRRPMMFTSNGFETWFWDDMSWPQRRVSGIFGPHDLQRLMQRRGRRQELKQVPISDAITDRAYQKEAIRAVCDAVSDGHRKALLVMATGTGKTRTAASLVDVLSRGGHVTNTLFLADRKALVGQARDDFKSHLPDMSLCNLLKNRDNKSARIVFSTYPTLLNAIDSAKSTDGMPLFTPAHFDLIVVDEAHRSIFNKYRAIFEYFDAFVVGLTATPRDDIDRNTYDFFEMEHGVPTYAYDYKTAVYDDHVLVPYYNIESTSRILAQGIHYDELSEADRERYEEDFFDEDGNGPEDIPPPAINDYIFNADTVDRVLQDLMRRGIKTAGGDRIGKTIVFAQNKRHAQFIVERFDKLYPKLKGGFARRVVCDDRYAQSIIRDFKQAEKPPHIAVSVDMLDTGIDVPEALNLVYFKVVRSKTKFWQMLGRGTRLCAGLDCVDGQDGEYVGKRRFYIFDYLGNFEFFRAHREGIEGKEAKSLSETIFNRRVGLIFALQDAAWAGDEHRAWRGELVDTVRGQVEALNMELVTVRMKRRYVEKYRAPAAFVALDETDRFDLGKHVASLVSEDESDEFARRFDAFMYGLMLAAVEGAPALKGYRSRLERTAAELAHRATIPQIAAKLPLIQSIAAAELSATTDPLPFERVRRELRDLLKFLENDGGKRYVYTNITDTFTGVGEGEPIPPGENFGNYRLKVDRYIREHPDHIAIHKLTHNLPLSTGDYQALSDLLTKELGNPEDYERAYRDLPFGLLVRQVAKLDRAAAEKVFSSFINDQSLNREQIVFVRKIVNYVVENGYVQDASVWTQPPFDRPQNIVRLFPEDERKRLLTLVESIRENAEKVG